MKNKFEIRYNYAVSVPEIGRFPGGEIRVRITERPPMEVLVVAHLFSSDDVMTLVMLVDALRNMNVLKIRLTMPYIPYARQDRVCNAGEAFSIHAFAKIINSLEFASVVVWDAHSLVSVDLIDRLINIPQADIMIKHNAVLHWIGKDPSNIYIVAPDKGAIGKAATVSKMFNCKGVIYAEKERDLATGKIIRTVVKDLPADIADARLLVVDDIGDGFGTFLPLAEELRKYNPTELNIYVTHGIFSRGEDILHPLYDNVWCSVDFRDYK